MSIFSALLDESDVATQLGPERFMIFAPTNDAFLRLIQDPPAYATCAEVIKNIAENHVIISKSTSTYSRDKPDRFSAINGSITHATYYPDGTIILNGSAIARPAKSPTTEYDLFKVDTVFASPPRPDETSR
ncbi:fasciclin domain-containing protein [Bauldia litoralis]|uniref:fasciclin domain-containing protein n=2 Tax=Pseudomonadota TaxID=1224 RepID=UPI003D6637D0